VTVEKLKKFGFTLYESRLLDSLLTLGTASVRELVQHSKVPKNKSYESLAKLEEKKMVETIPITPRKYKISNTAVFSDIISEKKKEVLSLEKDLVDIKERMESPIQEFKDFFTVIRGRRFIQEKLRNEALTAKKEILSIHGLNKLLPVNIRNVKKVMDAGVKVKFIAPVHKDNLHVVRAWKKIGCEIKVYDKGAFGKNMPRFSIVDNSSVRITLGFPEVEGDENYMSLFADSPSLAIMFKTYFMSMWNKLKTFEEETKK
jgi:sugar-specific transcriptional regulator TrmB